MEIHYSPRADTLEIQFSDEQAVRTERLDDVRMVDYSASGRIIALEFIGVSGGLDLSGLGTLGNRVEAALREAGYNFKMYA